MGTLVFGPGWVTPEKVLTTLNLIDATAIDRLCALGDALLALRNALNENGTSLLELGVNIDIDSCAILQSAGVEIVNGALMLLKEEQTAR